MVIPRIIPTRPAPSVPRNDNSRENYYQSKKPVGQVKPKKKPPPRPPPPKFNKKPDFTTSLIDLSAPLEDYLQAANVAPTVANDNFFEDDFFKRTSNSNKNDSIGLFKSQPVNNDDIFKRTSLATRHKYAVGYPFPGNSNVNHLDLAAGSSNKNLGPKTNVVAPTIIRAQHTNKKDHYSTIQVNDVSRNYLESNNYSPPMPTIPPPSPPKGINEASFDDSVPHAVALHNFTAEEKNDLTIKVNDVIILIRKVNEEWLYGKIGENEGMFPIGFVDVRVPLPETDDNIVTALYDFIPQSPEELRLVPGQKIKVIQKAYEGWLFGTSNGKYGNFPANYVDRIPPYI